MKDFITDDTSLASAFVSLGFNIKEMDDRESNIKFIFERTPEFEEMFNQYLSGRLPIEYFAFRSARDVIAANIKYLRPRK